MARHKQQRIGHFGTVNPQHGAYRYKVYACRCGVCTAAMSAYGKARYVPKAPTVKAVEGQTLRSWWVGASRSELSTLAQSEQARMSAAKITGRPSVPDGWR